MLERVYCFPPLLLDFWPQTQKQRQRRKVVRCDGPKRKHAPEHEASKRCKETHEGNKTPAIKGEKAAVYQYFSPTCQRCPRRWAWTRLAYTRCSSPPRARGAPPCARTRSKATRLPQPPFVQPRHPCSRSIPVGKAR